ARRKAGQGEQVVQAHAMAAVAKILAGDDSGRTAAYLPAFVEELKERGGRHAAMAQSAAQALGMLASPGDEDVCADLQRVARDGNDRQARAFATIALGEIGGDGNRAFLLRLLAHGHKAAVKPWAALALGVWSWRARAAGSAQGGADRTIGAALRSALGTVKALEARGAIAIALGLAREESAAGELRALLAEHERHDEFAGYVAIALGLLGDKTSVDMIRAAAKGALRRPQLLRQLAIALGMLGDHAAGAHLLGLLRSGDLNAATLGAVAGALGQIGDAAALAELVRLVGNDDLPDLARAFAAAAAGSIADEYLLPWNASLSAGVNYKSTRPPRTDGAAGVLDILCPRRRGARLALPAPAATVPPGRPSLSR